MGFRGRRLAANEYKDLETGETLYYGNLVATPLPKPGIGGEYVQVKQSALDRVLGDKDLTGYDLKVLLAYIRYVDWENIIKISQREISELVGINQNHVSRSTKKLVEKKILIEIEKVGRHKHYQFNEFYGWKGDSENYQKKIRKDAELG